MVACGDACSLAWSSNRIGYCGDLSDNALKPAFIGVALLIITVQLRRIMWRTSASGLATLAALLVCATIPIGTWMMWNEVHFGDLIGSTAKISLLGWSQKPFAAWWQHPIFTPGGLWLFGSSLIASFWCGELT
jgi:hypothetical protein